MAINFTPKLGQLLVKNKLITQGQLQQALDEQKLTKDKLGRILINLGYVSEETVIKLLQEQLGIPWVTIPQRVPAAVLGLIKEQMMRRHKVFPIKRDGHLLTVAMADPLDWLAIDELQQMTRLQIKPVLAGEQQIEVAINSHFEVMQLEKEVRKSKVFYQSEGLKEDPPVVKLVSSIIHQAIADRASDIHIEPQQDGVLVRERVDGLLREMMSLPLEILQPIVSRVKILSQLDIAIKLLPQEGRLVFNHYDEAVDLRISTMPTVFGEKVVLRILQKNKELQNINQLGFSDINIRILRRLIKSAYGMIVITGPTGSGKTTTLYAILNELKSPEVNIITIEDPVEYTIKGINQIQVNNKVGLSFAVGLRSILRQDPDIIMIGEIRDRETAEIAIRAASTGHLVLCTLHTNNAADAVTRLIDMGIEAYLVASSLIGVINQRLVRKICPHCSTTTQPKGDRSLAPGIKCSYCRNTGYSGRMGIQEVLLVSQKIKDIITPQITASQINNAAIKEGLVPIKEDGLQKALAGLTTLEEVERVMYAPD
ncbi:GspE/PulE family protein [Peptococcaceae bacterium 1198_IL3148]